MRGDEGGKREGKGREDGRGKSKEGKKVRGDGGAKWPGKGKRGVTGK